jgi:transcriptional regulator with XRE-family HTH domain
MLYTGNQLAAARALVGIDQVTLAKAAKISVTTIRNLESNGQGPLSGRADTVRRIQNALEQLNIEFLNGGEPGVRLRKGPRGDPNASIKPEDLTAENDE